MTTVLHAVFGYFFLLLTVRVLSRRPGAQLTPFEFVIVFIIGGTIIGTTLGDDYSFTNALCAVFTVAFLHRQVAALGHRWPRLGAWIDGTPLLLLKEGEWQRETMSRAHLEPTDVMAVARGLGHRSLAEVKYAVLERNGSISIVPRT